MASPTPPIALFVSLLFVISSVASGDNTNHVYSPCGDATVQRSDGFTFGIAFASRPAFFSGNYQLSPCDHRLSLATANSQVAVFRPKVDEISLLTVNTSNFFPCKMLLTKSLNEEKVATACKIPKSRNIRLQLYAYENNIAGTLKLWLTSSEGNFAGNKSKKVGNVFADKDSYGGYMVAFAGRRYAARSIPAFVANSTFIVTSFTLVQEFRKGRLQNLFWKRDGCAACSGRSNFVCLNNQDCAIRSSNCRNHGGSVDCSLGIQLAFSGTDKHESVFNSWYEVKNLRQYSLYGLYSNLRDSLTSQYNRFF
ncbi:expp1 protein [Striga asiatica]|uniref:Expp1 protein n=1 Tax=Striga asiatica TaxID=4170 RepID=A0A5A7PM75_STRAF|nr:expp1 protein [Striga asiatica]